MRLRLFHTPEGVRVAYREHGLGRPLVLVHSAGLTHREFEPLAAELGDRYRLVLCDLPGHGNSEVDPQYPYTADWMAEVVGAFCHELGGAAPLVGGHGLGADLLLRGIARGALSPDRLVLMPCDLHLPPGPITQELRRRGRWVGRLTPAARIGPAQAAVQRLARLEERGLSARDAAGVVELLRHATADMTTDESRALAWAHVVRNLPRSPRAEVQEQLSTLTVPTLLLWADQDPNRSVADGEAADALLPNSLLRVLEQTGYLMAYDDPVGVARELAAFLP